MVKYLEYYKEHSKTPVNKGVCSSGKVILYNLMDVLYNKSSRFQQLNAPFGVVVNIYN